MRTAEEILNEFECPGWHDIEVCSSCLARLVALIQDRARLETIEEAAKVADRYEIQVGWDPQGVSYQLARGIRALAGRKDGG